MSTVKRFREWLYRKLWRVRPEPRTKEQALRALRDHYDAFGIPNAHLNDEEFEALVMRHIKTIAKLNQAVGISARELAENMARAFRAINQRGSVRTRPETSD